MAIYGQRDPDIVMAIYGQRDPHNLKEEKGLFDGDFLKPLHDVTPQQLRWHAGSRYTPHYIHA